MPGETRVLVLALGNPEAGDDGVGPRVARELRARDDPRMRVVDLASGGPSALLDELEGGGGLIVVDAVTGPGLVPGEVVDVDWRDPARPGLAGGAAISSHAMSVGEQLRLADRLGILPGRVRIVCVALGSAKLGDAMSPAVRDAVPGATSRVLEWVARWSGA